MNINTPWQYATIVAVDTETTGPYPLGAELCELAAVKWQAGQVVDEYQTLVRPSQPMTSEVIEIHQITNEMVAEAPAIGEVIGDFYKFIQSSVVIAHHAPFDLGFLALELERFQLELPSSLVLCTSLLSRKLIPESPNHRLQTLVKFLGIEGGAAHRALSDAHACLEVGLESFRRSGDEETLQGLEALQGADLSWSCYSMKALEGDPRYAPIIQAIARKAEVEITYEGGSKRGKPRVVSPVGIVRNPQGDFLVAYDGGESREGQEGHGGERQESHGGESQESQGGREGQGGQKVHKAQKSQKRKRYLLERITCSQS